jgi:hypothetical protein
MAEYMTLRTPLGTECEVREVTGETQDGRRWHVRVTDHTGSVRTFYLSATGRRLPEGASDGRILRAVLNAVDDELVSPRERMAPDYETTILPQNFEDD